MNKEQSIILSMVLLVLIVVVVGISYAYWQISRTQPNNNINVAGTSCFEIETDIGTQDELNAIKLLKTYPISDSDGMNLDPFTFTITNTCGNYIEYQINLETINTTTLNKSYLKVVLDGETPALLTSYESVETTINGAVSSNKLLTDGLREGQSKTYNLRIWIDGITTLEQSQNKLYEGKVSIIASPAVYIPTAVETIENIVSGEPTNTLDVITKDSPVGETCTNTFGYDNTLDNNLRYVDVNPCNYVYFNCSTTNPEEMNSSTCELWQIIGVMNNVGDGRGNSESRIKLVRKPSLGSYSWDTSETSINNGYGINQWGPSRNYLTSLAYPGAKLMQELNGDYLNLSLSENRTWYNGLSNQKSATFDYTKTLKGNSQNLIDNALWYTGAYNDTAPRSYVTSSAAYVNERSTNLSASSGNHGRYCSGGTRCNDTIERTFTWIGKVGLQYPSDFGYATSGSESMEEYTRSKCINEVLIGLNSYENSTYGNCGYTSWLKNFSGWTLSPSADTFGSYEVAHLYRNTNLNGFFNSSYAWNTNYVYPSVYLKANIKITGGNGSINSPYTLGL